MEAKTMSEKLAVGIERLLKAQKAETPLLTRRMAPDALMAHALAELQKAASEPVERAKLRLSALGRAIQTAKQAYVDTASEEISVEVFEEETTAASDDSEKETSPVALEAALGNSAFAENPEDLQKALGRLAKEISSLRGAVKTKKSKEDTENAGEKDAKADTTVWPFDMNTRAFREGVQKNEEGPAWGYDKGRADMVAKP
jgi:hypothetical protein